MCARYDAIAKEDHSHVATAEQREDMKTDGYWYSTSKGKTVRRTNVKTTQKPSKSKRDHTKKLKERGSKSTPVNKFDNEQISRSPGTLKDLNVLTQRLAGSGTPRIHQQAHLRRHQVGMNRDFFILLPIAMCFAYFQWRILCKRRGGVNTAPIPRTRRTSAHVTSLAWLKVTFASHETVIFTSSTPCLMRSRCCSRLA